MVERFITETTKNSLCGMFRRISKCSGYLPKSSLAGMNVSRDGRFAVAIGHDNRIAILNVEMANGSGRWLPSLAATSPRPASLLMACTLIVGSQSGIRLWDLNSGQPRAVPLAVGISPDALAVSPDGETLAASSANRIALWDLPSRRQLDEFFTGGTWLALAFGADATLRAVDAKGQSFAWNLDPKAWIPAICRVANRALSPSEWNDYVGSAQPYVDACGAGGGGSQDLR